MNKLNPCITVVITAFFFFYIFGLSNAFNALSQPMVDSFNLSPTHIGFISSLMFYGNMAFLIPAGLMVDRIAPRKLLPVSMILCASFTLLMGLSTHVLLLCIARFLTGVCAAFSFVGSVRVAVNVMKARHLAKVTGVIITLGMLGGFVAQTPLVYLIDHTSWRFALVIIAMMGYLISGLIYAATKNIPFYPALKRQNISLVHQMKQAFVNFQNILCALYTTLMNLPIYMLGALWGIPYLMSTSGYSPTQAANICSMLFLGTMVGSPLIGILADCLKSKKVLMLIGALMAIVLMLLILREATGYYHHILLFFLLGVMTSTQVLSYPLVVVNNPKEISGTATSVISMISLLGGAVIQPFFGALLTTFSVHGTIEAASYHSAIKCLLVVFGISAIGSVFIKKEVK